MDPNENKRELMPTGEPETTIYSVIVQDARVVERYYDIAVPVDITGEDEIRDYCYEQEFGTLKPVNEETISSNWEIVFCDRSESEN